MGVYVDTDVLAYEDALGVVDAMYDQALDELARFDERFYQVKVYGDFQFTRLDEAIGRRGRDELAARIETLDEVRRNLFTHAVEESV